MAKGELFIRTSKTDGWKDAFDTWGCSFTETALSSLMTPAPAKAPVENKSRLQHGKRVVVNPDFPRLDERDVTLEMHIKAATKAEFWERYDKFCNEVLAAQFLDIKSGYLPDRVFHMTYESCSQFSEFMQAIAKFALRLNEPNPGDRKENKEEDES